MRPRPVVPPSVAALAPFAEAGLFGPAEIQLAAAVERLSPGLGSEIHLALAVAARAPRLGHVGVELGAVEHRLLDGRDERRLGLPWPDHGAWAAALGACVAVAGPDDHLDDPRRPLVWDGRRIYLQRAFHDEMSVATDLRRRASAPTGPAPATLASVLDALFPAPEPTELFPVDGPGPPDLQRRAAEIALTERVSVIAGGPGTGKTRTIARLLAAAHLVAAAEGQPLQVALAAPTGKAAARMTEAVRRAVAEAEADGAIDRPLAERLRATEASTIHRLLGWAPGPHFRHDHLDPLHHDVVIVDETSMVSLPLMASLLRGVRPDARLVLVGDPDQLVSVEAGTVLADLVGPLAGRRADDPAPPGPLAPRTTVLQRVHRFGAESGIAALAGAVRRGAVDEALGLLRGSRPDLRWVRPDESTRAEIDAEVSAAAVDVVTAARSGDALDGLRAAHAVKVLAATRHGAGGLHDWGDRIEAAVWARHPELAAAGRWYPGRPLLITENDPVTNVANGDVGLVVAHHDVPTVALPAADGVRMVPPARLRAVETWWAMTIHKSQGSEFPHVVVSLPETDSPVLTRELLYTAVTRAQERVTVVATETALRAAISQPVARASGLRDRLWPGDHGAADERA